MIDVSNIPKDEDTRSLKSQELNIGGYNCVVEVWSWDGIYGTSFIFAEVDIGNVGNDELINLVLESLGEKSQDAQVTISRKDAYAFVNIFFADSDADEVSPTPLSEEELELMRVKRDQWIRGHNAAQVKPNSDV